MMMMMMAMLTMLNPIWPPASYSVAAPESIWCSPLCPGLYPAKQPICCSTSSTSSLHTKILHLKVFDVSLCVLPSSRQPLHVVILCSLPSTVLSSFNTYILHK